MSRMKTFAKYVLCLVLFYIFSHIMIFIGLNTTYRNIDLKGEVPSGLTITSSKATSVNGEVKGNVSEELNSKYVKFNFYSDIDTLMGSYYITPSELENSNFEFYFKLNHVNSYSIELTDEEPEAIQLGEAFSEEEFKSTVLLSALIMLIFI